MHRVVAITRAATLISRMRPRACMALAQRIAITSLVEEPSAGIAGQRLAREFGGRILGRRIGHLVA